LAFEEAGWAAEIESPFGKVDSSYVRKAVFTTNERLNFIRFQVRGGGQKIAWLRVTNRK
jgi:hypothetical protein